MVLADSCFNLTHDSFDHDLYDVIKEAQNEGEFNLYNGFCEQRWF